MLYFDNLLTPKTIFYEASTSDVNLHLFDLRVLSIKKYISLETKEFPAFV